MDYKEALRKQIAAEMLTEAKAIIDPENWALEGELSHMPDWASHSLAASKMLDENGFEMESAEILAAMLPAIEKAPAYIKLTILGAMIELVEERKPTMGLASLFGQE